MNRNIWPVADHGIRPNGQPDRCFYCDAAKGDQHRMGCVIRQRTVVVRTIVEHTIDVPEDWGKSNIEFTEGSSCSDNLIERLNLLSERLDETECTCGMVEIEFVREATAEDEERSKLYVEKLPT